MRFTWGDSDKASIQGWAWEEERNREAEQKQWFAQEALEGSRERRKGNLGLTQKCAAAPKKCRKWQGRACKGLLAGTWAEVTVGGTEVFTLAIRELSTTYLTLRLF